TRHAMTNLIADDRQPVHRDELVLLVEVKETRDTDSVRAHVVDEIALDVDLVERTGRNDLGVAATARDRWLRSVDVFTRIAGIEHAFRPGNVNGDRPLNGGFRQTAERDAVALSALN